MFGDYHKTYSTLTDEDIAQRAKFKEMQLRQIFATVGLPSFAGPSAGIAVLGCADRRFIAHHERIFSSLFGRPVLLTTFDLNVEQLAGAPRVVQHDVTQPLPGGPYDLIYADILLRFIDPVKQLDVLKNSYDALAHGGMALHILNQEDIDPAYGPPAEAWLHRVDLNALQLALSKQNVPFMEVPARIEMTLPGSDDKTLIDEFAFVLRKS